MLIFSYTIKINFWVVSTGQFVSNLLKKFWISYTYKFIKAGLYSGGCMKNEAHNLPFANKWLFDRG